MEAKGEKKERKGRDRQTEHPQWTQFQKEKERSVKRS